MADADAGDPAPGSAPAGATGPAVAGADRAPPRPRLAWVRIAAIAAFVGSAGLAWVAVSAWWTSRPAAERPVPARAATAASAAPAAVSVPASRPGAADRTAAATVASAPASGPASVPSAGAPAVSDRQASAAAVGAPRAAVGPPAAASVAAAATARLGSVGLNIRPQLAEAARAGQSMHYALVSAPMQSRAEAEALLRRLRTQTQRIRHPSATETDLVPTPGGWRVSWWPFTNLRQADNARRALAARRIELQVLDF